MSPVDFAGFEPVRQVALLFPGTEDSLSYGDTPAIKVRGKLLCRLHDSDEFIPIRLGFEHRERYLDSHPELFHVPAHFKPYLCLWMNRCPPHLLREVLELGWRERASRQQVQQGEQLHQ